MPERTPGGSAPRGRRHARSLGCHLAPSRRSPRFLPQDYSDGGDMVPAFLLRRKIDGGEISGQPGSRKKLSKSPAVVNSVEDFAKKCPSGPLRRSPRLALISSEPTIKEFGEEEKSSIEKTRKGVSRSRRVITLSLRRSPRIAKRSSESNSKSSISQEFLEEENSSSKKSGQKRVPRSKEVAHQSLRRSPRIACNSTEVKKDEESKVGRMKVFESEGVTIDGMDGVRRNAVKVRRKRDSATVLTPRGAVENKRRKTERSMKEDAATESGEEVECCGIPGWTKEQEQALQMAYLIVKPSPHFWKKVSKMVPGKSAQECFDRVHADLATPPVQQPRSRTNRLNVSPIGYNTWSRSKSMDLIVPNTRRPRSSKYRSLVAQKTVRHLLRRHRLMDQKQEADFFSVLETSPTAVTLDLPEIKTLATPNHLSNPPAFLQKCNERSSSAHNKMLSRFKIVDQSSFESPEVLKQVKNMALHEKYIDQLHCREARRKASAKSAGSVANIGHRNMGTLKTGVLKAAKNALICEAKDVISQFQNMQANIVENDESFGIEDNDAYSDNDNDE